MKKFIAGMIMTSALNSLWQDAIGKERYLKLADIGWVDWTITVPIALAMIVGSCWLYHSKKPIE